MKGVSREGPSLDGTLGSKIMYRAVRPSFWRVVQAKAEAPPSFRGGVEMRTHKTRPLEERLAAGLSNSIDMQAVQIWPVCANDRIYNHAYRDLKIGVMHSEIALGVLHADKHYCRYAIF